MAQLLTESGLLALGGAVGGCLLAWVGIRAVAAILPRQGVAYEVQLRLVPEALIASLALAVVTTTDRRHRAGVERLAPGPGQRDEGVGQGLGRRPQAWLDPAGPGGRRGRHLAGPAARRRAADPELRRRSSRRTSAWIPAGIASVSPRFEHSRRAGHRRSVTCTTPRRSRAPATVPGVTDAALVSSWPYGGWPMAAANRPGVEPPAGARRAIATFCDEHYLGLVRLHPASRPRLHARPTSAAPPMWSSSAARSPSGTSARRIRSASTSTCRISPRHRLS